MGMPTVSHLKKYQSVPVLTESFYLEFQETKLTDSELLRERKTEKMGKGQKRRKRERWEKWRTR